MAAYRRVYGLGTCGLTAEDRDQLWNPTLVDYLTLPYSRLGWFPICIPKNLWRYTAARLFYRPVTQPSQSTHGIPFSDFEVVINIHHTHTPDKHRLSITFKHCR